MLRHATRSLLAARVPAARAAVAGQRSFFGGGADVPSDPKDLVLARPSFSAPLVPCGCPMLGRFDAGP